MAPVVTGETGLTGALLDRVARPADAADLDRAALHLLDWLGCALAASTEHLGRALADWGGAEASRGESSAIGLGPTGAATAAFVNGGLGNLLEMDDLHRPSILHAGDVVVPAALAAAQAAGIGGPGLLHAILAGYEVALRIGQAAAAQGYSGWYNSSSCGVFGAAVAAAQAGGLGREASLDALGHAGMQAAGLWQCRLEPTDSKQIAAAHAARAGVTAAALAARGLRGPRAILEGRLGFFATLYPGAEPEAVLDRPDAGWLLHEVSFKPWPACRHTHPAIAAALALRGKLADGSPLRIELRTYDAAIDFCDNPHPASDHEARFSLQHAVAAALLRGAPALADSGAAARQDAAIQALRARVRVQACPEASAAFPPLMSATLDVIDAAGQHHQADCPSAPGDPEDPLSPAQIATKFETNASVAGLSRQAAQTLAGAALALPRSPEATSFYHLLAKAAVPARQGELT